MNEVVEQRRDQNAKDDLRLELAFSYMDDVQKAADSLENNPDIEFRAKSASSLLTGDLRLAAEQIARAQSEGCPMEFITVALARHAFVEGVLCLCVVSESRFKGKSSALVNHIEAQSTFRKWINQAVLAFQRSVQYSETPEALWNLGLTYVEQKKLAFAAWCFERCAALAVYEDEVHFKIEALKELGRIGVKPEKPSFSSVSDPLGSTNSAISSKKSTAGILAICLGVVGAHKFYQGQLAEGFLRLGISVFGFLCLFLGPIVMGTIGIIEGLIYLSMTDLDYESKYFLGRKKWF